jgi:hypothetical protein
MQRWASATSTLLIPELWSRLVLTSLARLG